MRTRLLVFVTAAVFLSGCAGTPPNQGSQAYSPVFATGPVDSTAQRGSLKGDYDWAASARELREAANRWEEFLRKHKPANGEYGDAFHKRHVDAASYELVRIYYLMGDRQKGDELLKQLDPLQLR